MSLPNRGRHRSQIALPFVLIFIVSLPALGLAQLGGKPEKSNFTLSYTQTSGALAVGSEPLQSQLSYLDEKDFPE